MAYLPRNTARHGKYVINSVELHGPTSTWCRILNLETFRDGPELRGSDVLIPGLQGAKARRRRATATEHALVMVLAGDVDHADEPYGDFTEGLASNLNYLHANVIDPPTTTAGTRSSTFTDWAGDASTKPIHVLGFHITEKWNDGLIKAVLDISIPGGRY